MLSYLPGDLRGTATLHNAGRSIAAQAHAMTPFAAVLLGSQLLVPVADGIPTLNIKKTCQLEAGQSSAVAQDMQACLHDQQAAHDELIKQWGKFPVNDKDVCLNMATRNYLPGYIELLTCLEMFQFARTPPSEAAPASAPRKARP